MSDTIIITMKVTANEKSAVSTRMISRVDEIRAAPFDFIEFEFDHLSAPLKDMVMPLLDDRYDGPVTINVEARAGDKVFRNEKSILNGKMKKILRTETLKRGLLSYGSQQQELEKRLVDALFDEAAGPVKKCLKSLPAACR